MSARWAGRCGGCAAWNTLLEEQVPDKAQRAGREADRRLRRSGGEQPLLLSAVGTGATEPIPTGITELDRVLSGGFVPGSVTLVGGEPGIGKSTLLLQAAASAAQGGRRALLVAAEESADQVRRRAERLGAAGDGCYLLATVDLQSALEAAGSLDPQLLVVDSIQTIGDASLTSQAGSTTQVTECAQALAHFAKTTGTAVVLVGHVTKDGALAGPRALEHLVDTVLSFDGDRHHSLRHLSAVKHRYGSTGEVGLFEMAESGLVGLSDPSAVLLGDRRPGVPGSVVTPVVEGRRPLLLEVQVLVGESRSGSPRRVVQGVPPGRLALLLAVLERFAGVSVAGRDLFVSTVGGIKVAEPATDLAVALAIVSAATGIPIPDDDVVFGEVGLGGELRQTPAAERRLSEAARLGFRRAVTPFLPPSPAGTMSVYQVASMAEAVGVVGLAEVRSVAAPRVQARILPDKARSGASEHGQGLHGRSAKGAGDRPVARRRGGLTVVRD